MSLKKNRASITGVHGYVPDYILDNSELEKIVDELEGNEISLDEAVKAYERGSKLKNICQERLNEAKMKVEKIKDFDKDEI